MEVIVELGSLLTDIPQAVGRGLIACREQILNDCNFYCLQDEGILMGSAVAAFDPNGGTIEWDTPYARRRYYEGKPKRDINPDASLQWAEKARDNHAEDWARQIAKGANL